MIDSGIESGDLVVLADLFPASEGMPLRGKLEPNPVKPRTKVDFPADLFDPEDAAGPLKEGGHCWRKWSRGDCPDFRGANWRRLQNKPVFAAKMGLSPLRDGRGQVHVFGLHFRRNGQSTGRKMEQSPTKGTVPFSRRNGSSPKQSTVRRENRDSPPVNGHPREARP